MQQRSTLSSVAPRLGLRQGSLALALCVAASSLAACAAPAQPKGRMTQLATEAAKAPEARGLVSLKIQQAAPKGYGLKFVSIGEWERAQVTLSRVAPAFTDTQLANALVATNGSRSSTINFANVPTGAGFSLSVNLQRRDGNGTYQTIASGTNNGVTIAVGANNANVAVTATAQGQLNVTVNDPTQTFVGGGALTGTMAAAVNTNSQYTLATAIADPPTINSISALAPKGAGYLLASPVDNRIFDTTNGNAAIMNAGATAYTNACWGMVRMSDGSYVVSEEGGGANTGRVRVLRETAANIWDFATVVAGGGASNADTQASGTSAELSHARYLQADEDGTLFFAEVGEGKIWRIDPTSSSMMLVSGGWPAMSITGLAWDRANDRMYVAAANAAVGAATTGNVWRLTDNVKGTAVPISTNTSALLGAFITPPVGSGFEALGLDFTNAEVPHGITYDPTGNLYVAYGANANVWTTTAPQTNFITRSGIIKIPLTTAGDAIGASRQIIVAGAGGTFTGFNDLLGLGIPGGGAARNYNLGSLYGGGLYFDTANTNGGALGGHLIFPSNNDSTLQLLRLTPPSL